MFLSPFLFGEALPGLVPPPKDTKLPTFTKSSVSSSAYSYREVYGLMISRTLNRILVTHLLYVPFVQEKLSLSELFLSVH